MVATELSYLLPRDTSPEAGPGAGTARFPALFDALEAARGSLRLLTYSVSMTSLEEVFLRLATLVEQVPIK